MPSDTQQQQQQQQQQNTSQSAASTNVTLTRDRYDRLIHEFQRLKEQNQLLKKALLSEKNKHDQMRAQHHTVLEELREKAEENDVLSFNNRSLERKVAELMFEVDELRGKLEATPGGSSSSSSGFLARMWSGSSSSGGGADPVGTPAAAPTKGRRRGQSEEASAAVGESHGKKRAAGAKLDDDTNARLDELEHKIAENEALHMQMFELKQEAERQAQEHKDRIQALEVELEDTKLQLEQVRIELQKTQEKARSDREKFGRTIHELKEDLRVTGASEANLRDVASHAHKELAEMRQLVARKVPFDDTQFLTFNSLNVPPHDRHIEIQRVEIQERVLAYLRQLCNGLGALYACALQKIQLLSRTAKSMSPAGDPAQIHAIHTRLTTSPNICDLHKQMSSNIISKYNALVQCAREHLDMSKLLETEDSSMRLDEAYRRVRVAKAELLHKVKCAAKEWLHFQKDSLLYVIISMQEGEFSVVADEEPSSKK